MFLGEGGGPSSLELHTIHTHPHISSPDSFWKLAPQPVLPGSQPVSQPVSQSISPLLVLLCGWAVHGKAQAGQTSWGHVVRSVGQDAQVIRRPRPPFGPSETDGPDDSKTFSLSQKIFPFFLVRL